MGEAYSKCSIIPRERLADGSGARGPAGSASHISRDLETVGGFSKAYRSTGLVSAKEQPAVLSRA